MAKKAPSSSFPLGVLEDHIKEVAKRIKKGEKLFEGHDIEAYFHGLNVARNMVVGEMTRQEFEQW